MESWQHACVARFDEPVFCANDGLFILKQYYPQVPSIPASGSRVDPEEFLQHHGKGYHHTPEDGVANEVDISDSVSSEVAAIDSGMSVLCSDHPRPQCDDLCEEENGRVVRFALDGDDNSVVPQFIAPLESFNVPDMPVEEASSLNFPMALARLGAPVSHADTEHPPIPNETRQHQSLTAVRPVPALPTWQSSSSSLQYGSAIDEQWLPVDDARRQYDVAGFVEDWQNQIRTAEAQHSLLQWQHSLPGLPLPPEDVYRYDAMDDEFDIQGIHWSNLGVRREEALAARARLHPNPLPSHARSSWTGSANALEDATTEGPAYRFRSYVSRHRAQSSHYQLRNVLAATSRSDVMYANRGKIYRTSLAVPLSSEVVVDLVKPPNTEASFRVTCLASSRASQFSSYQSDAIVLVGGFNGEYAMQNLNSGAAHAEGFLTHATDGITTHIHTFNARRSGLLQAAFCSNDRKLRLMDTHSQRFTDTFTYPCSVNCSATSPDGRLRVLVGDDNEAMITNAEKGDVLIRLNAHTDHGFACAWAEDGVHVTTGAQDGICAVWDARNWSRPLVSLPSTMTCPRSVHFTDRGELIVAESEDIVSIYNTSIYDKCQDLRFFGSIAGVTLLNGGAEIAVANSDQTVGGLLTFERTRHDLQYVPDSEVAKYRSRHASRSRALDDSMSDLVV